MSYRSMTTALTMLLVSGCVAAAVTQEIQTADRIRDYPARNIVVFGDLEMVWSDVKRLFEDITGNTLSDNDFLSLRDFKTYGIDTHQGIVAYEVHDWNTYAQLGVTDAKKLPTIEKPTSPIDAEHKSGWTSESFSFLAYLRPQWYLQSDSAVIADTRGWIDPAKGKGEQGDENEKVALSILQSQLLAPKMNGTARQIINDSGLSWIGQAEHDQDRYMQDFWKLENLDAAPLERLRPEELAWLKQVERIGQSVTLGAAGLKYHEKTLVGRVHLQANDVADFEALMVPEVREHRWIPDLGLEANGLMVAAAIQFDAFRSSVSGKLIPSIALYELGRSDELRFLQGNMLQILTELVGDSWNDLTHGRVAMYVGGGKEAGRFSIFGIADARDPAAVMTELRRLDLLTCFEELSVRNAELEAELSRLIDMLNSEDENKASRAETRLVLAGARAANAIGKARAQMSEQQRARAERVFRRIEAAASSDKDFSVTDPGFWTSLNPSLKLNESTGKVAGFTAHTISVSPDPTKSDEEVKEAIEAMEYYFGQGWRTIHVVQVREHFVFMVGSDMKRLEQIVTNVEQGTSQLIDVQEQVPGVDTRGQIHLFIDPVKILRLYNRPNYNFQRKEGEPDAEEICWLRLDVSPDGATLNGYVPVQAVVPFVMFGL